MLNSKEKSYIYDEPVIYKNLKIFPVKVKDYLDFYTYIGCLTINKNSIPDVEVISMSYYDYLCYIYKKEPYIIKMVDCLFRICLGLDRDENVDVILYGSLNNKNIFKIGDDVYNSDDFDNIKTIICEQNLVELPEDELSEEVRNEFETVRRIKNKSATKMCNFEEQLICVSLGSGLTLEEIENLTIRKFSKYLRRIDHKMHYEIYKTAISSGFITVKDESFPKHWMADLEQEDKYSDVLVDEDEVKSKIKNENGG